MPVLLVFGLFVVVAGAGSGSALAGGIAPAGDFEADPAGSYYTNGPCGFGWASDVSHSAAHSLRIVSTQPPGTLCRWMSQIPALPVVEPGELFHADAYLKTQGVIQGSATVTLTFWDAGQGYIPGSTTDSPLSVSGTQDWTDVRMFAFAPAGAKYVRVEFRLNGPGTLWADDLTVLGDSLVVSNLVPPELVDTTALSRFPGFVNLAGDTLTASQGEWTGNPTGFLFEFDRCNATGCVALPNDGGNGHIPQYTTTIADVGSTIGVTVFAGSFDASGQAASNRLLIDGRNAGCFSSDFCTVQLAPDVDLEADPSASYYTNGPCAFGWATDQSHSPTHSLKIVSATGALCRWMSNVSAIPAQPDSGIPGATFTTAFTASAYLKTQGVAGIVEMVVTYWTAGQAYIPGSARTAAVTLSGTQDWTSVSLDANQPPPGSAFMRVEFRLTGAGALWIDDLNVSRTTFVGV